MKKPLAFLLSVSLLGTASALPLREFDWHMPAEHYKNLDFTDRATLDRAVKIFQQAIDAENRGVKVTDLVPRYRAAAGEFRKVQVQGESEDFNAPMLGYAVFMQAYARQQAHDRNEAIKLFSEVLDLYPEQTFVSVPARYLLACVYGEMGETKKRNQQIEELLDDKQAEGHRLYFSVLRDRAGHHWGRGEVDDAIAYWSRVVFAKNLPGGHFWWEVWRPCRDSLVGAAICGGDWENLEKYVLAVADEKKPQDRMNAISENVRWVRDVDRYDWHMVTAYMNRQYPRDKKANERKRFLEKMRKDYARWLDGEQAIYDAAKATWQFRLDQLRAHAFVEKPDQVTQRIKALADTVGEGLKDDGAVNGRISSFAHELIDWYGRKDDAIMLADRTKGHPTKLRLLSDLCDKCQKYKESVQYLEEYVGLQPPPPVDQLLRAKYDLGWRYVNRTQQYDKAIKLYGEMDDPPKSLWSLADAQRRGGKKKEAYTTLTEVSSIFPKDAANAVLTMARWRADDGEKEKAIALYKRLLTHPEWKKTGASSEAHQALERWGIKTGGAMTNEVR